MSHRRPRATAVVIDGDRLLVIRRFRDGDRYAVLPGGGVEAGESAEQTCVRELAEETGLRGRVLGSIAVADTEGGAFFLVAASGNPELGGPERIRHTQANSYDPGWVGIDELDEIGLVPASAHRAVEAALTMSPGPATRSQADTTGKRT